MESFADKGQEIKFTALGDKSAETVFIWAHGWGQDHRAFLKTAHPLDTMGLHILVDFPGFGSSPIPSSPWDTKDYADFMIVFLKSLGERRIIWIGHSFGCRVGIQIAAHEPHLLHKLVLIAAAGLKRKRNFAERTYFKFRIALYKFLKKLTAFGLSETWLKSKFGSKDYKNAGLMRDILVKTVNEDLTDTAQRVTRPTLLIFGKKDDQTPPEMGERYNKLIRHSALVVLDGYDHYTILSEGHHQLTRLIKDSAA